MKNLFVIISLFFFFPQMSIAGDQDPIPLQWEKPLNVSPGTILQLSDEGETVLISYEKRNGVSSEIAFSRPFVVGNQKKTWTFSATQKGESHFLHYLTEGTLIFFLRPDRPEVVVFPVKSLTRAEIDAAWGTSP